MKVFITGATGYIGHAVACMFRDAGHEVWGLIRHEDDVKPLARQEIRPVVGDLNETKSYEDAASRCQILIHAARVRGETRADTDQETVKTLLNIGRSGHQAKTVIYTSTVWVYGNTNGYLADETEHLSPIRSEAWRPETEERVVTARGVKGLVLRPGVVYGKQGGITGFWFDEIRNRKSLTLIGDGANRWAMIHVADLARAYLHIAEWGGGHEIFNVTDGSIYTPMQLAESVARAMEFPGKIQCQSVADGAVRFGALAEALALDQVVDSGKARALLNWKSRHRFFPEDVECYLMSWLGYRESENSQYRE